MVYGTYVQPTKPFPLADADPTDQEIPQALVKTRHVPEKADDNKPDGVAIISGGLDSITTVYHLVDMGHIPHLLSFDYGQRHVKELEYALACAERLGLRWSLIDLSSLTDLISNSALTSKPAMDVSAWQGESFSYPGREIEVPEGHYAEDNMRITVVPNRNMMMMSIALAVAINEGYTYIAAGMHSGDHAQYPDCRPEYMHAFLNCAEWANEGFFAAPFTIKTPFINLTKNDIAAEAFRLNIPLEMTWSCYKGGRYHCGRCATCVERLEAINSVPGSAGWDRTVYEDSTYWRTVVKEWNESHG